MHTLRTLGRAVLATFVVAGLAGCENQLPTITGADRFPEGSLPTTVEVILDAEQFLRADTVYDDFADPLEAPYLLVAREFDGALDARTLVRWTGFPDSVTVPLEDGETRVDTAFTYGAGRISTTVAPSASFSSGPARLRLWALDQGWDSTLVDWTVAQDRDGSPILWREPGGTRGELLAEAVWTPGDTASADSVIFNVDSLAVARVAEEGFPGVVLTSETPGSRIQLSSRLVLETEIRAESRPDTALDRTFSVGPQEFVFTPPPPGADSVYRAGGITGARTVMRLDLSQMVPGCESPATDPECPQVPLREVTLNEASLMLQPLAVPLGFRPLGRSSVRIRRLVETELGRLAPLAESFALDSVPAARFDAPGREPVSIELTDALSAFSGSDSTTTTVALLSEPEGGRFGYLWFAGRPRLRLVYTLPLRPRLP